MAGKSELDKILKENTGVISDFTHLIISSEEKDSKEQDVNIRKKFEDSRNKADKQLVELEKEEEMKSGHNQGLGRDVVNIPRETVVEKKTDEYVKQLNPIEQFVKDNGLSDKYISNPNLLREDIKKLAAKDPDSELLEDELKLSNSIKKFLYEQYSNISKANDIVQLGRPVNPDAVFRLLLGADGKKFNIHGKSSNSPPIGGLVPVNARLSKLSERFASEGEYEYFQGQNKKSIVDGKVKLKNYKEEFESLVGSVTFEVEERYIKNPSLLKDEIKKLRKENEKKKENEEKKPIPALMLEKMNFLYKLGDIIEKIETQGIVTEVLYRENGRDVEYLTDGGEILYDDFGHAIMVSGSGEDFVIYGNDDRTIGGKNVIDYMKGSSFGREKVMVMAYQDVSMTCEGGKPHFQVNTAKKATADIDGLTSAVGQKFPKILQKKIKKIEKGEEVTEVVDTSVDELLQKSLKKYFDDNPGVRTNLNPKINKTGPGIDINKITIAQFEDFIERNQKPELLAIRSHVVNDLGKEIAKYEHDKREEEKDDDIDLDRKKDFGNISKTKDALRTAINRSTNGMGANHGSEDRNPRPENWDEKESHSFVDQNGQVKMMKGVESIVNRIEEKRKEGYPLPVRPEWCSINEKHELYYDKNKSKDWFQLRDDLNEMKSENPERYESEKNIFDMRYQIESLRMEPVIEYTDTHYLEDGLMKDVAEAVKEAEINDREETIKVMEKAIKIMETEHRTNFGSNDYNGVSMTNRMISEQNSNEVDNRDAGKDRANEKDSTEQLLTGKGTTTSPLEYLPEGVKNKLNFQIKAIADANYLNQISSYDCEKSTPLPPEGNSSNKLSVKNTR